MKQLKSEQIAGMIKTLIGMDNDKYDHIQNWKYILFLSNGQYVGFSNLQAMSDLIHFPPFHVKEDSIRYLEYLMKNPRWVDDVPLETKDDIDNILDGDLVDHSTRLHTFLSISDRLRGELYWYGLKKAKNLSWKNYYYRHELRRAFIKDEPQKETLMTQEEHAVLDQLPGLIDIYRITGGKERDIEDYGVSWTISPGIAQEIGETLFKDIWEHSQMAVKHLQVSKSDLIVYWDHQYMQEVIYVPQNQKPPNAFLSIRLQKKE